MSLVSSLVKGALSAERQLGKILDRREEALEKKDKLNAVEETWASAIEDGIVDASEQNKLQDALANAGLDRLAKRFEGRTPIADEGLEKISSDMDNSLNRAQREVDQHDDADRLQSNLLLNELQFQFKAASDVMRTKHNTYKAVIDNMKA